MSEDTPDIVVDSSSFQRYVDKLPHVAPSVLADARKEFLDKIGAYDIQTLRATGLNKLSKRFKGADKAFKYTADENEVSEFSNWRGAKLLTVGGIARSGRRMQLLFTDAARKKSTGRRKYSQLKISRELKSGKMKFIKRPGRTTILVRVYGKLNKRGGYNRGARLEIIAYVKRYTVHKGGWYSLEDNWSQNQEAHNDIVMGVLDKHVNGSELVDKQ